MTSRKLTTAFVTLMIVIFPAAIFGQWIPSTATGTDPIHYTGDTKVYGSFFLGGPSGSGQSPYGALYLWPDASGSSIRGTGAGIELLAQSGTIWLHNGNTSIEGWDSTSATNTALTVKGSTSTTANGALNVMNSSGTSIMYVRNDGSVGIGTQNPGTRFTVAGYSNNGSARISVDRPTSDLESSILFRTQNDPASQWKIGKIATTPATENLSFSYGTNSPSVVVDTNGNVALGGTPSSVIRLDAYGPAAVYGSARRIARLADTTAMAEGVGSGMDFLGKYNTAGSYTQFANIKGVKATGTDGEFTGNFVISINNSSGNVQEVVRVTPTSVTVNGTLTATQVIGATYQDVAEWVPASMEMRAGTVVVVDSNADNGVMPSSHSYDTAVAGVISAQPGVILGVEAASKAKVATTGRIKVHVDATRLPIRAGDLLVTSDRPGMAMRSEPIDFNGRKIHQPGTIIGKALQPLAKGEGEILVLLSLQ